MSICSFAGEWKQEGELFWNVSGIL
jgi:hypothetical protein